MQNNETCSVHEREVSFREEFARNLEVLITDVKWIKRFGIWSMSVTGGAIVLIVPFLIAFAVYVSNIDRRLSVVEQSFKDHVIVTSSTTTTTTTNERK